jgi:hypothetical protein
MAVRCGQLALFRNFGFTRMMTPRPAVARPLWLCALAALLVGVMVTNHAQGKHPEPDVTDTTWRLDFEYNTPDAIALEDAQGNTRWYWYMPYKVINNTGEKQLFVPDVVIADNTGRVVKAGANVPAGAFEKIKARLGNSLLRRPTAIAGPLLVGADYAKESVLIWPASKQDVDSFRVFIAGLSGETAVVENPRTGEDVQLQRTLMLEYHTPGDVKTPENQTIRFGREDWVMR